VNQIYHPFAESGGKLLTLFKDPKGPRSHQLRWPQEGTLPVLGADIVFAVAVGFVVACNLYFHRRIGDRIAMQWGVDGKPTWYAPKWIALWGMVVFMIAVRAIIWAAMTYYPEKVHGPETGVFGFAIIAAASHLFLLLKAAKSN
jgi:Protein of unknown function (DUF1648)